MRPRVRVALFVCVSAAAAPHAAAPSSGEPAARQAPRAAGIVWKPGFGRAALWNDGNAEVSVYEARDSREGLPRSSRAVLIVVAEDLSREKLVKADRPTGGPPTIRVLKLNHVRSIPTGVYVFDQMLSVSLEAETLDPVKLTMTSHEWCGNSFVEWRADRKLLALRSYFEAVGDADVPLDPAGAIFYDALPLVLRGLDFERTTEGRLRLLDTVFSSSPSRPASEEAFLRIGRPPAGGLYRVTIARGARRDVLDFEAAFPHRLARWERSDGGLLTLLESKRFPYWQRNRPGDEKLLPAWPARY